MNNKELDSRMRQREYFHGIRIVPGNYAVIRVDGRSFSRFTNDRYEKPFDEVFCGHMVRTAAQLMIELRGVYAYTESDEISILIQPEWDLFDRELEKTVSVSAGIASAIFTLSCGESAHFDSRVWVGATADDVVDYFCWRQADASRNAISGYAYWTLRKAGLSAAKATSRLAKASVSDKNEVCFEHGINYNETPLWQRRGVGIYWEQYEKDGFNPITSQTVKAIRNRLKYDYELPMKEQYAGMIQGILLETLPISSNKITPQT